MRLALLTLSCLGFAHCFARAQSPADTTLANQYYQTADSLSEQGKYEEANQLFRQAQGIYQAAEDWEQYIACLNSIAYNLWPVAAYDSATAMAQQALQLSEQYLGVNHPEAARAYDVLGTVQGYAGRYLDALDYYQRALQIRRQYYSDEHLKTADSYTYLGIIHEAMGQYDKALYYHQKVLRIRKVVYPKIHSLLANSYEQIGIIYKGKGKYNQALSFYQQALAIRKKLFGEVHHSIAVCYDLMGTAYERKQAFNQALLYHQRALSIVKKMFGEVHTEVSDGYGNIGVVYSGMKLYERALMYYKKGLTISRSVFGEVHPRTGIFYNNIGNVYEDQQDYNLALVYYLKALNIKKKTLGKSHLSVAISYNNIGALYEKKNFYEQAMAYYQEALNIFTNYFGNIHPRRAITFNNVGRLQYKRKLYTSALYHFQQSLIANGVSFQDTSIYANPILEHYSDGNELLLTLKSKTEILSIIGLDSLAYATCLLTDSLLNQLRHSYRDQGDKAALGGIAEQLYEKSIQTALQLHHTTQDLHYLQMAFYFSEKSKAGILADALSASEAKQFGQVPDSLLALETSLKADRSFYQSQLASADSSIYQNKLFAVNRRYDSLMQVLEAQFPDYYQLKYAARTAKVPDIQSQLASDEAVISYFVGDSTQYAFIITATQFQVITLPQDSLLDQRIQVLRRAINLDSTSRTAYQQRAYALYQQLLAPVVADSLLTGIRRLTIIPDGALGYLPFELLLTQPASADTEYAALPYLMRDYTVRYGYSATWLFHPFSRSARPAQDQYIAFAPNYPTSVSDTTQQLALGRFRDQVSPLRFNGQEANNIQHYLSGVALTDKEAVERRFKEEANQYRIIHLAMHALVDDENPMYSRLVFTPDATDTLEDGYLNAYELYNMELSADLAVLSACETGYGKLEQGEGIMSLARAFAYAGCPSIVMSHWTVEDAASAQLMNHFYRYLSEGLPKDEALRQAKLAYLETASVQDTHPFFWGNFVVIGDTTPIVVPRPVWQYWLIGGGVLLIVGLVVWFLQRHSSGRRYHKGA